MKIYLDSGYSSLKGFYNNDWYKIPTSISFSSDSGILVGTNNSYDFEGDSYIVGESSIDEGSFSTTDFKFKLKFEPLIIKHFRDVLGIPDNEVPEILISLALVDWSKKDELIKRCSEYEINGKIIKNKIEMIPQGFGAYYDFVNNINGGENPTTSFLIEIGYNTINVLYFNDGKPVRSKSKGHPNHGVSSIIKPFTNYLESEYGMAFSEQESIRIFTSGKLKMNGNLQDNICSKIKVLKSQFIKKLFNSILVADKKLLATSDVVIIAGGGSYFLEDVEFPSNVKFVEKPYEFSNIRGMVLVG